MIDQLKDLRNQALEKIGRSNDLEVLESARIEFLGRREGKLNEVLKGLKDLSLEEKKAVGPLANQIRREIEQAIEKAKLELERQGFDALREKIDITLPGKRIVTLGKTHPITQIQREWEDLFLSMGFMVLDGPEVESDYYNFEALNIPAHHPARDMQDTFWLDDGNIMRPQTSAVQVRALEEYGAPIKAIVPGRCYRYESVDACHEHTFYQIEGMMVDKDVNVANLIAVMRQALNRIFEKDIKVRLRPGYFPFVEPAFELDISCLICAGKGCCSCKNSGWLEILPCGMIHPNVLRAGNVDPQKYSGFAFAVGLDRLVMMRYGINDIRYFHENDIRFLSQF